MNASLIESERRTLVRDVDAALWYGQLVASAKSAPAPAPSVEIRRETARAFARSEFAHQLPLDVACEDIVLPCDIPARWFRPRDTQRRAPILYFHGGGYVCGSIDASAGLAGQIASIFGAPLLAVGYRQAPEHPIPAAIVDAHTAHAWLSASTPEAITLIGDSAGGQLAVSAASIAERAGLR
jgi:acetyl esterase/lipase